MPQSKRVFRLTPKAVADLEDIWSYTAQQWSPEQAEEYHASLLSAITGLSEGKLVWQQADHIRLGYLKFRVQSHVIFFKITALHLDVIRILHKSMDFGAHLG